MIWKMLDFSTQSSYSFDTKLALIFAICYPIIAMPMSGELSPTWGQEKHMAKIVVRNRSGRRVSDARVEANTTTNHLWGNYNRSGTTDHNGVCELEDGENRYHILVNDRQVDTVNKLRGTIEVTIWPQGLES
jgi:hypothetical protein